MSPSPRLRRLLRLALVASALVVPLLLLAHPALARPGGGASFSGGFHGGGGHGGGGGGDLGLLIWLIIVHPAIGIPLAIVLGIVYLIRRNTQGQRQEWSTQTVVPPPMAPRISRRRQLQSLSMEDESFSVILFEDFLYALYARAHEARGKGALDGLSPWLTEPTRTGLAAISQGLTGVHTVVVGAMRYVTVSGLEQHSTGVTVDVAFEANYTEVKTGGGQQTFYAAEAWRLFRRHGVQSRPPEKAAVFACPSCGAALSEIHGATCAYCGNRVDTGAFDWVVQQIEVIERQARGPQLTGTTAEEGTDLPTVLAPDLQPRLLNLKERDASFDWAAFEKRVRLIYDALNGAWTTRDWQKARPFVSDNLFHMQQFWIDAYREAGLTNVLEKMRCERVEAAAVTHDKWYDAITVRLYGTGLDYTVRDADHHVVGGSKNRERRYSEYWTLIRGTGTTGKQAVSDPVCPNCGAPLDKITMAGECEYCGATVTTGKFDWVLSRIEQDEVYTG